MNVFPRNESEGESGRYLAREKVLNGDCNPLIYCFFRRLPVKSLLQRSWLHPFGPRLFNITDFYYYIFMHPLKNFYTPLSRTPQKCFQSGPALANADAALNEDLSRDMNNHAALKRLSDSTEEGGLRSRQHFNFLSTIGHSLVASQNAIFFLI